MKKLIAIILTVMMCAALAACGGKKPEAPAEEPQTKETEQAAQNETTPEQTTPEETTPEQTTPEQTTPEQTTPEQTTPAPASDAPGVILKSDDTHMVLDMDGFYIVVVHEGDKVTNYYAQVDLEDEELAKLSAQSYLESEDIDEDILDVYAIGTYVIMTYKEDLWGELSYSIFEEMYGDYKVD